MKMEFIFDDDKLKQNGYTKDQCLNVIRKMYARHNSKTIKEIQKEDCLAAYYKYN